MSVRIIRVLGIRAKEPGIVATVDDNLVRWNSRRGWDCACLTDVDEYECDHIEAVRNIIDQRVTEPVKARAAS